MSVQRLDPEGLSPAPGYSYVTVGTGRHVFAAGAVPLDEDGALVGEGDAVAQTARCLHNLKIALEAAGASATDVAKVTIFVVPDGPGTLLDVWGAVMSSTEIALLPTATTLLGISALGYPGQLVEIEATAVVD
jgi:enamine deaminase RidA (YjgF/YER057c/UK114 family)